jgi:hypothetical protein
MPNANMLSVALLNVFFTECHYAECLYADVMAPQVRLFRGNMLAFWPLRL